MIKMEDIESLPAIEIEPIEPLTSPSIDFEDKESDADRDAYEAAVEQERAHNFGSKYTGSTASPLGAGGRNGREIPQYLQRVMENKLAEQQGAPLPYNNIDAWGYKIRRAVRHAAHHAQLKLSDFVNRYGTKAKHVFGAVLGKIHREKAAETPIKAAPVPVKRVIRKAPMIAAKSASKEAEAYA